MLGIPLRSGVPLLRSDSVLDVADFGFGLPRLRRVSMMRMAFCCFSANVTGTGRFTKAYFVASLHRGGRKGPRRKLLIPRTQRRNDVTMGT